RRLSGSAARAHEASRRDDGEAEVQERRSGIPLRLHVCRVLGRPGRGAGRRRFVALRGAGRSERRAEAAGRARDAHRRPRAEGRVLGSLGARVSGQGSRAVPGRSNADASAREARGRHGGGRTPRAGRVDAGRLGRHGEPKRGSAGLRLARVGGARGGRDVCTGFEREREVRHVTLRIAVLACAFALIDVQWLDAHKPVTSKYTYWDDVYPIVKEHCGSCHAPGGVAPMSLLTYDAARPWAESIRLELTAGHMPPW